MRFYLGTHKAVHLERAGVPLFVSHRTLRGRKTLPRAIAPWALDSGAFTELNTYGRWTETPEDYADAAVRYADAIGQLEWIAPQDSMCEPFVLDRIAQLTGTRPSVQDQQRATVANYLRLRELLEDTGVRVIPVLQGWTVAEYAACWTLYDDAGVDLATLPLVGIGSVCRRQGTEEVATLLRALADAGLQLHGFGVKLTGLRRVADVLASADSLAWSLDARRGEPLRGCSHGTTGTGRCSNCLEYALRWLTTKVAPLIA